MCDYRDYCKGDAVAVIKVSSKRPTVACCEYCAKQAISVRNSNIRTFKEDVARKKARQLRWNDPERWFMSPGQCHRLKEDHPNWEELMGK